ncbi:FecR family protein [Chitinophaga lutea]
MPHDSTLFETLYQKVRQQTATPDELRQFLRMLEDREGSLESTPYQEWAQSPAEALPAGMRDRLFPKAPAKPAKRSLVRRLLPYAAAAALVIAVRLFLPVNPTTPALLAVRTADGEIRRVVLPDSSVVTLNARSQLRYERSAGSRERRIVLEGQAFFDVRSNPDSPFVVYAEGLATQVLGTSFDVRAYPGVRPQVAVLSGRVRVSNGQGLTVTLSKGRQASYESGRFSESGEPTDRMSSWQQRYLDMEGLSLREVAAILERTYGVNIVLDTPGIGDYALSGHQHDTSLQATLESICFVFNLRFEQTGRTVHIRQ